LEGLESVLIITAQDLAETPKSEPGIVERAYDAIGSFFSAIWHAPENIPKEETGKQQEGTGINIYDKGKGGPDNKYLPSPDPNSKNFNLEKSVVDALTAISESTTSPSSKNVGERAENLANAADKTNGGVDAAKDANANSSKNSSKNNSNNKSNDDSNGQKIWTNDSIKVIWGDNDSVSWIVNQKK